VKWSAKVGDFHYKKAKIYILDRNKFIPFLKEQKWLSDFYLIAIFYNIA
jgi:hypothetical protein